MEKPTKDRKRDSRGPREVKEFEEHILQLDRVTRVVKGGRRMRFRATVVIGDNSGRVAIGLGKGTDVQQAVKKAVHQAKKDIVMVPMVAGTITHPIEIKYKAARLRILPAAEGTGIKLGGALRKLVEMAGVKNILGKSYGTSNRVVVAQAAILALKALKTTKASEEYIEKLQKERSEHQARLKALREAQDAAGEGGPRRGGNRGGDRRGGHGRGAQTASQEAAQKLDATKGRLEEEASKA